MKTALVLLLSLASTSFAAQTRTVPVSELTSAEFTAPADDGQTYLNVMFNSGGCKIADHKVLFKATLVSKTTEITSPELKQMGGIGKTTKAVARVSILEQKPALTVDCAMGFELKGTVSLTKLLIDNAKALGLNPSEVDADTEVEWILDTPLKGYSSVTNFPARK